MMKKICLLLIVFFCHLATADEVNDIEITDAYVRGLPPGVANTAAFMKIRNTGSQDLVLIGGSTDIAETVSIHETENNNGMMSMTHRMTLTVPAGEEVVLETGGLHLMLMGLKNSLPEEDVTLTLEFQGDLSRTLILPVISVLDE